MPGFGKITRRQFMINGIVAGGLLLAGRPAWSRSDRVRVGLIGLGSRGRARLIECEALPQIEVRALCDIDRAALAWARRRLANGRRGAPAAETDFNRLLDRPDLDAVLVAGPLLLRSNMARLAIAAGKHVYVEPPWAATLAESQDLLGASKTASKLIWQGPFDSDWNGEAVAESILPDQPYERVEMVVYRGDPDTNWGSEIDLLDSAHRIFRGGTPTEVRAARGAAGMPHAASARFYFSGEGLRPRTLAIQSFNMPDWRKRDISMRVRIEGPGGRVEHYIEAIETEDVAGAPSCEAFLNRIAIGDHVQQAERAHFATSCLWLARAAMESGRPLSLGRT